MRYDEDNLVALDFGCHSYLDGNPVEKIEFFKKRLGQVRFNLLQARARQVGKVDRNGLMLYFQQKIKELCYNG